jgi:hypothetical protein
MAEGHRMGTHWIPLVLRRLGDLLCLVTFVASLVLATLIGMRGFFKSDARRRARIWLIGLLIFGLILLLLLYAECYSEFYTDF